MMKLHKYLSILGHKIKVAIKAMGDENHGLYHPNNVNLIEMDKELAGHELRYVYVHEFGHGVIDKASLHQAIPEGVEEILCDHMAKATVDNFVLMCRNPGDTVVKHYAVYSAYGDLKAFHTESSIEHAVKDKDDVLVELMGVTKFKRKRKVKSESV